MPTVRPHPSYIVNPECHKWITHTKGEPNKGSWEICVIREENTHGFENFGWSNDIDKIYLAHSGTGQESIDEILWELLIKAADEYAAKLNEEEAEIKYEITAFKIVGTGFILTLNNDNEKFYLGAGGDEEGVELKDLKIYEYYSKYKIHSVKRLKDNIIFTIGDKVKFFESETQHILTSLGVCVDNEKEELVVGFDNGMIFSCIEIIEEKLN